MLDGLWRIIHESQIDLQNILIFVPSRRAARSIEKMIVDKIGHAVILPQIVPLGVGMDGEDLEDTDGQSTVSALERVVAMSYILSNLPTVRNISAAIPVARTLITMQDYLENSGKDISDIDWNSLIDDRYAAHFRDKSQILDILSHVNQEIFNGRETETKFRNSAVYAWCDYVKKLPINDTLVIVCGSTASVPVTRKLMTVIAGLPNGRIILSGKISGRIEDLELDTNPYNSEYKFLCDIGLRPNDVCELDFGKSHIDFMNVAFGNEFFGDTNYDLTNCHLIETNRESEEAAAAAEIAERSIANNKSVLIITPDAAGNQRLMTEFNRRGIVADFSGGISGTQIPAGRAILNLFDDWIESGVMFFDDVYSAADFNLFDAVAEIVERFYPQMSPQFIIDDAAAMQVWNEIKKLSDCLSAQQIRICLTDARAFIADALSGVRVRSQMNDMAPVVVLGTIESRMQTADVVILTGLNEGMFPALGYENPWLPRRISVAIGMPSPNHKVSLMALDFMTLSCGADVYWLRSKVSGGVQTQESRFISRVIAARGLFDKDMANEILNSVRSRDVVPDKLLRYDDPTPPADWSDVYVTELETLIHNPYAFYVGHILRLHPERDYWDSTDARDFGNLVHDVLEHAPANATGEYLVSEMDRLAREKLGKNNLIFAIWHRRFMEIAPLAVEMLRTTPNAVVEIGGVINIAGRNVRARADRIWPGGVLDIKTGAAPSRPQVMNGNMPQLPLEALMLKNGGFAMYRASDPIMRFLQLQAHHTQIIEYSVDDTITAMQAAYDKTTELFNMYSAGAAAYKYMRTSDPKYKAVDDFARADERD